MLYSTLSNRLRQKKAILLSFLALFCVLTAQAQNRIYVSPQGGGDGSSWDATIKLGDALAKAQAGDEIWLKGFQQITDASQLYVAPENGWTVPSGVKIFGGFEGKETSIDQRKTLGKAYQMTFRSVLSGDINKDDKIDPNNSIFPENTTRSDNAKHVLVLNAFRDEADNLNDNSNPTVVDGLTIVGGHAADFGGGIYVKGDANTPDNSVPYSIDRCYLLNNYGYKGGAIYVDASVKKVATQSLINQCVVYNNVAGTVIGKENLGGGIYIDGAGNIVNCSVFNNENGGVVLSTDAYLVNTTVARNTGAGVDMTASPSDENAHVYNSVIWGNSFVAAANWPVFSYSAYPDAPAENNNINLSKNNQGDTTSPRFDAPSLKTSFDIDYDWRRNAYPLWSRKLREGSYLIDKGNNDAYNTYAKGYNGVIGTDLNETARIVGNIDINAYEFETVPASRIRYVKTNGSDSNDGQSWETAYASVQKAINDLALSQPGVPGEVWVAAGTYQPTENINGNGTPASFRMYDGISLYGGFAGSETTKSERARKGENPMPWQFTNETILRGSTYNGTNTWNSTDNKWSLTSASTHVVWFAPLPNQADFQNTTVMEGFTIEGGQAKNSTANDYDEDKGAGVYLKGANVYLIHSIVKDNVAPSVGGGIYLKDGRVQGCLVYNNSSGTNGGGIYVDNAGLVLRSMITNNSAQNGGGVYLDNNGEWEDGMMHPEYLILSTSIVTNNTSVNNGAVYCNKGGVILQSTIANNNTPTATDNASGNASQTGGLYINEYSTVVNTVLWNNLIKERKVQLYAANPTAEKVQFHYSAVANMNNIVWNNTLQDGLLELSEENQNSTEGVVDPGFTKGFPENVGVQGGTSDITYFWQPITGSNLRARGMSLGLLPENVLVAPELDITGKLFDQKPAVGAYRVEKTGIVPEDGGTYLRIYVDVECTEPAHDGSSWDKGYRSLNEAIDYMAGLTSDEVGNKELQIYVMEGDVWPRYASVNLDPKSATIEVPAMASGKKLIIKGGYSRASQGKWAPLTYRSQINGNHEGKNMEDGLYHCITVEKGAIVEFDGFHIINGYAAGTANLKYGAGMLVRDGANVTVKNSIFENNTAVEGAAIDARGATLSLINCVVNNNTNTTNTASVINCPNPNLTMNHVSVVNNIGAAPAGMGIDNNSFAAGNADSKEENANTDNRNNTLLNGKIIEVNSTNFVNPTNKRGASLGFDTYLGGYTSFMPTNACPVVNQGEKSSGLTIDITGVEGSRSRGGAPDLGAYEAELPVDGTVIYVRQGGTGDKSGSSWNNACATIGAALAKAKENNAVQEIWVSAGEYTENLDMIEGVNVLGGFAATGNPTNKIDGINRDISNKKDGFKTTIQGSDSYKFIITEAQNQNPATYSKNKRVLTQSKDFGNSTMWEGFIITGGQTGLAEYGAGVKLMKNGHLKNCRVEGNKFYECGRIEHQVRKKTDLVGIPYWSSEGDLISHDETNMTGGGGVYCIGGTIENCQLINNKLDGFRFNEFRDNGTNVGSNRYVSSGSIYGKGAGLSISGGSIINCVIAQNVAGYDPIMEEEPDGGALTNILGAAAFVQSQSNFYSSTIVENTGGWSGKNRPIIPGVWDESLASGDGSYFYNCIIIGNYGYGNTNENFMQIGKGLNQVPKNLMYSYFSLVHFSEPGGEDKPKQTPAAAALEDSKHNVYTDFGSFATKNVEGYKYAYDALNLLTGDFELNIQNGTHPCLNTGSETYLSNKTQNIHIVQDANGYDRIQDCAVDMGAYESANESNLAYETSDGNTLTYYVNENGAGLRNGSSVANAACAMKLQQILTHAGQTAKDNPAKNVVVKISGYENGAFKYRANTLSDPKDPQSYTFAVPYGIIVEGGYSEDFKERIPKTYQTILSALAQGDGQDINGYHTVTFGEKPSDWNNDLGDKITIIDGLYLIDGKATSMAGEGNPNTRGGGAIVPAWAHVRNCVVAQCEAIQGGALYLLPGATVSGTLIMENKAEEGAGVYADAEGANATLRAHMISNTITDNTASSVGGGIYMEDEAVLTANSVIWGNTAPSDKNVSGVVGELMIDNVFRDVIGKNEEGEYIATKFYPFNHCYVETYELPSNYENTSMKSDESLYFAADRTLKAYSELIKHGTVNQDSLVKVFGVAITDMQNILRKQDGSERIDVGAYAFDGGLIPLPKESGDPVVKKIFVSQGSNVAVTGKVDDYIGRSFYTSLSWLDDALEYIKKVRAVKDLGNTEFEIYLAGGTYKPSIRRGDAATTTIDQRQNSYVIPAGVKIYGGFNGTEQFGYNVPDNEIKFMDEGSEKTIPLTNLDTDASGLIDSRAYSDLNGNGINEPWEMANQTILSGDINVSPSVKNAYHVVYSSGSGSVLLDGLTIKDGETWNVMSPTLNEDEVGRGGALYTNGVDYILKGCRVMNSKAVRGGAIYARDANLTIIGSVIAGNGTVENAETSEGQDVRGGAVYMSGYNKDIALKAINTLWANNETTGKGGAIATSNDRGFNGSVSVSLMNNTIVRNKAAEASAIYSVAKTGATGNITNTVMWGGEGTGVVSTGLTVNNSASDIELTGTDNVKLSASNMAIDGPRFAQPSSAAGVAANDVASKWNPASISVLTDAGDGQLDYNISDMKLATGAYKDWWGDVANEDCSETFYTGSSNYNRYMGPKPVLGQTEQVWKIIDIGLFEYQYKTQFLSMDTIYVDTQERGDGSGDSWANATSDLRGAILALSNPDPSVSKITNKTIKVRGGEYPQSQLYVNKIAYQAVLNGENANVTSLTIKGSYAENGQQDFSQPTVFLPSTTKPVETMFYANTNGKTLNIEGVTFQGAKITGFDADNSGTLNLKNVAFRQNGTGAHIKGNGATLFANALFADGTTGLKTIESNVTVVNATFANNTDKAVDGTPKIYNTVAWKSGTGVTSDAANGNIDLGTFENDNILEGPNFVDPDNENVLLRNYMIRPSIKLIDAAVESHYNTALGDGASTTDKDLGNNARKTGDGMDIGAYEYNAALQQIVYVKYNVAQTDGSGSSWQNPIKDLQSAIDLASVYANKNNGQNGYVFVHRDANASGIRLNMPNVKVYGGMNDEVAAGSNDVEKAKNLINARSSVLANTMSTINGLTVNGASSVIDGFKAQGTVTVTDGMLSTSVVEGDATVETNGIVYNSFVRGTLSGDGKAVNVTSPVLVTAAQPSNVLDEAPENGYVSDDIWKYQPKETDLGIDNRNAENVQPYMEMAGHEQDLSGSKRVRNIVDAGCFESWNITTNTTLTADDMPTNKHVVYVRKGVEADIAEGLYPNGTNFNVGFLLLEHGAGLRSNGNAIKLTNFAVERSLTADNNHWDMCYMPFDIDITRSTVNGSTGLTLITVQTYDGARRAAYDYQFKAEDGAWIDTDLQGGKGLLLQSTDDAKVRMYGNSYTEAAGQSGQVQLAKYNNMQPWNSENSGTSQKFTHLENMSWNMFGSPFLCAMNYDDMEYGRVIYKKGGDTYASVNTSETSGSIEAGSAVFTQTATLQTVEEFNVNQRTSALSETGTRTRLAVAVAPQGQGEQDELTLTAVPTEEASDQFNMAADGVKMMTVGKAAQIYLERGGKHYSMLTALDLEGKIDVGVLAPESGMYSIFIPEDCPMDEYETVVLEDKTNGRMVDLLEGGYDFQMNEAGTLNSRFTLSFNRELAEQGLTRIRIQAMGNGQVRITGLMDGDQITAYQENGTMTYSQRVASAEKNIALPGKVCLIKVVAADGSEIVKKLVIR